MKKIIVLASAVLILIIVSVFVFKGIQKQSTQNLIPTPTVPNTSLKTFKSSSTMDFTIKVPLKYEIEEKAVSVVLSSTEGNILIGQNGTNFDNLQDYLQDLSKKNKFTLTGKVTTVINGMETTVGKINNEKYYFIYAPDRVYSIYTSFKTLYSDLDQIAQSFRYSP